MLTFILLATFFIMICLFVKVGKGEVTEKKRSIGITAFVWFYILFNLIVTFMIMTFGFLIIAAFLPIILAIATIGILKRREWGRKLHLFSVCLSNFLLMYFIYMGLRIQVVPPGRKPLMIPAFIMPDLLMLIPFAICIMSIIYLTRSKVKEQFK